MIRLVLALLGPLYGLTSLLAGLFFNVSLPSYKQNFVLRVFAFIGYKPTKKFLDFSEQHSLKFYRIIKDKMMRFPFEGDGPIPCTLLLSATDLAKRGASLHYVASGTNYQLPISLKDDTDEAFNGYKRELQNYRSHLYDYVNARLKEVRTNERDVTIVTEGVSYFDYMRTNLCLDYVSRHKPISLRERVHPDGVLDDLSKSLLANTFGINVMLISPGGQMIIQKRSMAVVVRPGELAPSFSGTIEPRDVIFDEHGVSRLAVFREGIEELGIEESHIHTFPDGTNFRFLGLTRELVRGGQPELFGVAFTKKTVEEIQHYWLSARDQFESRKVISFPLIDMLVTDDTKRLLHFRKNVKAFTRRYFRSMSLPLKVNLSLLNSNWSTWQEGIDERAAELPRAELLSDAKYRLNLRRR